MKGKIKNYISFAILAAVLGLIAGVFAWLYMRFTKWGIALVWEIIPSHLKFKYYTIVLCTIGGIIVGSFHKIFGCYPDTMVNTLKDALEHFNYPYEKIPLILIGSLLPIFFGGAVGPESGMWCIFIAMVFWIRDQYDMARWKMIILVGANPSISRWIVLREMLSGIFTPRHKMVFDRKIFKWKKSHLAGTLLISAVSGLAIFLVLNIFIGRSTSIPHMEGGEVVIKDKLATLLLIAAGVGAGYLYFAFRKVTDWLFGKLVQKELMIVRASIGGVILGIIGTVLPMTMFAGGSSLQALQYGALRYTPYLLILIGVVKLLLTNVCIQSGWVGGYCFPVAFGGISIGIGLAQILGTNEMLSVELVCCALLGTMMQNPAGALFMCVVYFPSRMIGWMLLAALIGGCCPLPAKIRDIPGNKGFIYTIINSDIARKIFKDPPWTGNNAINDMNQEEVQTRAEVVEAAVKAVESEENVAESPSQKTLGEYLPKILALIRNYD